MSFDFKEQTIAYTYHNAEKYPDGHKIRRFRGVKQDAAAAELKAVGQAFLPLFDGDSLQSAEVTTKSTIDLMEE